MRKKTYSDMISKDHKSHVYDGVYIGSFKATDDFEFLKNEHIVAIFNLSGLYVNETQNHKDLKINIYNLMDIEDKIHNNKELYLLAKKIYNTYDDISKEHKRGHILINCRAGVNRSALTIGTYLKIKYGMDFENIMICLRNANFKRGLWVLHNPSFRELLKIDFN